MVKKVLESKLYITYNMCVYQVHSVGFTASITTSGQNVSTHNYPSPFQMKSSSVIITQIVLTEDGVQRTIQIKIMIKVLTPGLLPVERIK